MRIKFYNREFYHSYNRGVEKRDVFCDEKDYGRFLKNLIEFNSRLSRDQRRCASARSDLSPPAPLVNIVAYCLNQNHFHFLLEQFVEGGITSYMRKVMTGYTMYFNLKYNRSGHLFQGAFKSKHIVSNDYFIWLSAYINGNPEIHKIAKAENYKWSSYQEYLGKIGFNICDKNIVLDQFKNIKEYQKFVKMVIKEARKKKEEMEEYILE